MAFIYDLSDTWNNAGISFSGIKINVTDSASAAGSKLLDLQIGSASKFTVGKTGTVTATGIIESTVGGFRFPDGTTQTTKATVNSVSGTGTVNGITLTGTVTDSGSLTLGGTLGNIANSQLTNSAITINGTSTALGGSISVGTVTSVSGTGTVNGLTLTGSVTTSGSLTLGGTLGNIANSQLTNSAITINGTSTALGGSISVGTVTSVAALTLGTSGTDLASSVANGTTTPVITLNVPTASASNRGALSSSDWSTFNAKQAALVSGTNIKTVGGVSLLGSGDVGTIGLAYGGTGATTASGARTALGLGTAAVLNAGVAGGVATLDGSGTVPTSQLPGAVLGGLNYQGTWNASTNTPTLASSTGSKGHYYVVSVAGSTNLNGITDWKIGDWAVYDGTTWQKVDNTDAVSSVNGFTGAVVLTTSDVAQGTNLYFTQAAARGSVSAGTGISYNSGTGVITNSAPDQTVALTGAGTTVVTGTYPNFTITSNDSTVGTVTSVAASGGTTGLSFTGSPITSSGTLTLGGTLALASGGTGATTASGARTALGLGTAATTDASAYATAAQGAKADTAVQTIASTDGSVTITGTTALDLSVAVAGSTSNVLLPVRNTTGATLTKGTAVYISGATGQLSTVSKAIATGDATSAQTLGLVTANIANNSNGNVTLIGTITNIDTSAYTDGQQLYLSPTTAGTLTGTKPYAPNHLVYMAVVESAHPSQGKLFVKVQNGYEMDELHDVSAQSPTNGQTLVYNSTTDLWEKNTVSLTAGVNGTLPVANGGTGATTLSSGYLLKGNGTSAVSASVVYDNGTNVGIGTSSPGAKLDVVTASGDCIIRVGNGTSQARFAVDNDGPYIYPLTSGDSSLRVFTPVGSEAMRIDSSGFVGIGTSSPLTRLHVQSAASNTMSRLTSELTGSLYYSGYEVNRAGTAGGALMRSFRSAALGGVGWEWLTTVDNAAELAGTYTSGMVLNNVGQVGIGTSSPAAKLHVLATGNLGTFESSSAISVVRVKSTAAEMALYTNTGEVGVAAIGAYPLLFKTQDIERVRITSGGDVGIGTSSLTAGYKLDVSGSANASGSFVSGGGTTSQAALGNKTLEFYNTGAGDGLIKSSDDTSSFTSIALNKTQVKLYTANTERMRIDSSGNVGVGTQGPSSYGKLAVIGNIATSTDGGTVLSMRANAGATTLGAYNATGSFLSFNTNASGSGEVERMRITSTGAVGIGTTTPTAKLDVNGAINLSGIPFLATDGASNYINVGPSGTYIQNSSGSSVFGFITNSGSFGIGTSSPQARLDLGNTTGEKLRLYSSAYIGFGVDMGGIYGNSSYSNSAFNWGLWNGTTWTERMRIDSSGNLLVGTTTALGRLTVAGGYAFVTDDGTRRLVMGPDGTGVLLGTSTNHYLRFITNDTERARIDTSGNFMVGGITALQSAKITAYGSVAAQNGGVDGTFANAFVGVYSANSNEHNVIQTAVSSVGTGSGFRFRASLGGGSSTTYPVLDLTRNQTIFYTDNAERMRIDSSGRVGIGVSNPGYPLAVGTNASGGTIRIVGRSADGIGTLEFGSNDQATTQAYIQGGSTPYLLFGTTTAERMRIDGSGNLLVGTTAYSATLAQGAAISGNSATAMFIGHANGTASGATYVGFVYNSTAIGSITQSGTTAVLYNLTSDARLKENVADADDAASLIDAIQVRKFDWKSDGSHQRYGFVAQELVEVAPEAVHSPEDPDEMMAVDYSKLVPMLVKEIQSLRARVAQLEGN
jgi:hypothetical protein